MRAFENLMSGQEGVSISGRIVPFIGFAKWSMVLRSGDPGEPGGCEALEAVCRNCSRPVYCDIRHCICDKNMAEDPTESYFA